MRHAIDISSQFGITDDNFGALRDAIARLVTLGLLVSDRDLLRQITNSCRGSAPPPISTMGFVTCDRPAALTRAVRSAIDNAVQSGRTPELVVMDDSDEGNEELNRQSLRSLAETTTLDLLYAGHKEKEEYARQLVARSLLPPEVIRFALFDPEGCNYTTGANRNALLLDRIGHLLLSIDDDVVCRAASPPQPGEGIRLTSCYWHDFWFYADRESAVGEAQFVEKDILGAHEAFLGHGLGDFICGQVAQIEGEEIGSYLLRSAASGKGRIVMTMPGAVGDSGMAFGWPFLLSRGETYLRLTSSKSSYRYALTSREVLKISDRPTLDVSGLCMTTMVGLDNRELLPPFMPVYRNEDGIFGTILARYFDEEYSVHLPWAAFHDAKSGRSYWSRFIFPPHISDILPRCIASHTKPLSSSRARRLDSLGQYLVDLGSLPIPEFQQQMRLFAFQQAARMITRFENILKDYADAPEYWTNDVKHAITSLQQAIANPAHTAQPSSASRKPDESELLAQRLVRRYGELLCAWPSLITCAKELCRSGHRMAYPVKRSVAMSMSKGVV